MYESTRGTNGWQYGALHVELLKGIVEKFKAALRRRAIAGAYQGVEHQLESLDYPLSQLAEYFAQQGKGRLNERDAEVCTSFVESGMSQLQEIAVELDGEYAEQPK